MHADALQRLHDNQFRQYVMVCTGSAALTPVRDSDGGAVAARSAPAARGGRAGAAALMMDLLVGGRRTSRPVVECMSMYLRVYIYLFV
jgi:hypothetical protein